MKRLLIAVIALVAMTAEAKTKPAESAAAAKKRAPAQAALPKGPVTLAEKATVCRGIEARYRSTRWDKCRKAKFSRDKEHLRVTLNEGTARQCRARLKPRARAFDLKTLKCD